TVNSELVQNITFRPGGYSSETGRGMGGVLDVESRRPRSDGYHGFAQLDLIDASVLFEGKLAKNLSMAFAVRRSTLDLWLPHLKLDTFQATPTYYDYQARLNWRPSTRDELDVFFFGSDDVLTLTNNSSNPNAVSEVDSHIFYHRAVVRYSHRWARTTLTITPSVGYDAPFQFNTAFGNTRINIDARTLNYALRAVVRTKVVRQLRIDFGVDFEGNRYSLDSSAPLSGIPREGDPSMMGTLNGAYAQLSSTIFQNTVAPFVEANFFLFGDRLIIVPQLRLDVYNWTGEQGKADAYSTTSLNVEPRLAMKWRIRRWVALKAAVGVYHQ